MIKAQSKKVTISKLKVLFFWITWAMPFNPAISAIRFVSTTHLKAHSNFWYLHQILRDCQIVLREDYMHLYSHTQQMRFPWALNSVFNLWQPDP